MKSYGRMNLCRVCFEWFDQVCGSCGMDDKNQIEWKMECELEGINPYKVFDIFMTLYT